MTKTVQENKETTIPAHGVGDHVVGYVVNVGLDKTSCQKIADFQQKISAPFRDYLWLTPPETLHITVLDLLTPHVEYGKDKDELFEQHFSVYDTALQSILHQHEPIPVRFDTVKVTPGAIIAIGQDNGQMQRIRSSFLQKAPLLSGTKQPPTIIHFTIARYLKELPLQALTDFVSTQPLAFDETITSFRLVRENVTPMLSYTTAKEYRLTG